LNELIYRSQHLNQWNSPDFLSVVLEPGLNSVEPKRLDPPLLYAIEEDVFAELNT